MMNPHDIARLISKDVRINNGLLFEGDVEDVVGGGIKKFEKGLSGLVKKAGRFIFLDVPDKIGMKLGAVQNWVEGSKTGQAIDTGLEKISRIGSESVVRENIFFRHDLAGDKSEEELRVEYDALEKKLEALAVGSVPGVIPNTTRLIFPSDKLDEVDAIKDRMNKILDIAIGPEMQTYYCRECGKELEWNGGGELPRTAQICDECEAEIGSDD